MNQRELGTLGATALAGVVAAVLVFLAAGASPSPGLASIYVNVHIALLFCCLGCLMIVGVHARTAQPRLIATFAIAGGLVAVGLFWSTIGRPFGIVPYATAGVVGAVVVAVAVSVGPVSKTRVYELATLQCCSLFVFGFVYFSLLTLQSENSRYLVPLVVATSTFLVVTVVLRNRLSVAT